MEPDRMMIDILQIAEFEIFRKNIFYLVHRMEGNLELVGISRVRNLCRSFKLSLTVFCCKKKYSLVDS